MKSPSQGSKKIGAPTRSRPTNAGGCSTEGAEGIVIRVAPHIWRVHQQRPGGVAGHDAKPDPDAVTDHSTKRLGVVHSTRGGRNRARQRCRRVGCPRVRHHRRNLEHVVDEGAPNRGRVAGERHKRARRRQRGDALLIVQPGGGARHGDRVRQRAAVRADDRVGHHRAALARGRRVLIDVHRLPNPRGDGGGTRPHPHHRQIVGGKR